MITKLLGKVLCRVLGHRWSSLLTTVYKVRYKAVKDNTNYGHTLTSFTCIRCGVESKKIRTNKLETFKKQNKFTYK